MLTDSCCQIIPSTIFEHIAVAGNTRQRELAFQNLNASAQFRGQRVALADLASVTAVATGEKRRTIYDAQNGMSLPGKLVRSEGDPKIKDPAVNEAYDGSGKTYDFYRKVFQRSSIDGKGMRMDSTVHYRRNFSNAFWNGQQMVYGDGDGEIFNRFTRSLDVIGHELTHGITQIEAGLHYSGQPGALNEHFSDVFGSLIKQYFKKQKPEEADWLIGVGIFAKQIHAQAIRSMKSPGSAYDDPLVGKDPQPAHMDGYVTTHEDNGGVHINSGIPNKAFYNFAIALGSYSWLKSGKVWYITLIEKVRPDTNFRQGAKMTYEVAGTLYGAKSWEQLALQKAWADVGIAVS
jgi:Zn-dependent metalloprotease